jgi:23S rRNA (adenine-N6)-dimethyltransferase
VADLARSRRAWGWHPLVDEWAARIVADAGVRPGSLVLDIGAGRGALTRHLVDAGAKVIAVEPHPGRARWLRERFPAVTVVECDVLALRLPRRPFRVVANPPYSITGALLRQLLAHSSLVAADLVLQRAVVRRHVEQPPRRWHLRAGLSLPRNAFRPPPQVDSAVLVVRRRRPGSRRAP